MASVRDICNDQDDEQGRKRQIDAEMKYDPRVSSSPTSSLSPSSPSSHPLPHADWHQRGPSMAPASSSRPYRSSHSGPSHHNHHQHHYSSPHDQYGQHPDHHQPHRGGRDPRAYEHHPPPPPHGYVSYSEGRSSFSAAGYPHPHHTSHHHHQSHYQPHHHQEDYPQPSYPSAPSRPSYGSGHTDERRASSHSHASSSSSSHMDRHVSHHQEKRSQLEHQQQQIKAETVPAPALGRISPRESMSMPEEDEKYPLSQARIKIVQQPLHARMCGFGEKDRRPIDPPPIVQLIVDEPNYDELWAPPKPIKPIKPKKKKGKKKGAKKGRKPGKKALALAAAAAAAEEAAKAEAEAAATQNENKRQRGEHDDDEDEEGHDSHDEESEDDQQEDTLYELDDDEENDEEDVEGGDHNGESSSSRAAGRTRSSSMSDIKPTTAGRPTRESNKEEAPEGEDKTSTPPQPPKRRGRPARNSDIQNTVSAGKKHSRDMDDASGLAGAAPVIEEEESDEEQEWPRYEGGAKALRQDPLYVLHVSLWSEDGSEVRSMIATPGQTEPPKLTRILMGAVVVSPILLNNERGEPGWYFSFPDLSIRTEGVYTLKFSLMRFAFFDFDDLGGSHASTIIAEELSQPFTVFSAKKFPGMTESTELSKAFAKQGLKIPIRNDLRVRKTADKD